MKGKYAYMAPEQTEGDDVDHRIDIFSCGIVLHEVLTGRRLFKGQNDVLTIERVRRCDVPPPSQQNPMVPPELDAIVLRALARDRSARWATAADMADAGSTTSCTPRVSSRGTSRSCCTISSLRRRRRTLAAPVGERELAGHELERPRVALGDDPAGDPHGDGLGDRHGDRLGAALAAGVGVVPGARGGLAQAAAEVEGRDGGGARAGGRRVLRLERRAQEEERGRRRAPRRRSIRRSASTST